VAFRRQDIPKTTRKSDEGPARIYPRLLRDAAMLPKIDLAIEYLEGMLGRRRGELAPDLLLELFGDPKLARCLLASMSNHYQYRTTEITDVIGNEAAAALLTWDIATPADLRTHLYLAANAGRGGFVADGDRDEFLTESADALGLTSAQLDELIHLDAERNAVLIRVGPKPESRDVLARYNALLCLSVLRHASAVEIEVPGLDTATMRAVCDRHEVLPRMLEAHRVRLDGRRSATGSWSGFGMRLARCAVQLLILAPKTPSGEARIHFGDRAFRFVLDAKTVSMLRPKLRAAAEPEEIAAAAELSDAWSALRRESPDLDGWRLRRWPEPIVVDGCVVLPELAFTREQTLVAALPVVTEAGSDEALAALDAVGRAYPVVAVGDGAALSGLPAAGGADAWELGELLSRLHQTPQTVSETERALEMQFAESGWVKFARLAGLEPPAAANAVAARLKAAGAVAVDGFGYCRPELLAELRSALRGPVDVAAVRRKVAERVGATPEADALTLYLLTERGVIAAIAESGTAELAAA
jgi:predicted nuclease of restriction endonuclease-like RecB superfamily